MRWASSLSIDPDLERAMADALTRLRADLDATPDLLLAFVSAHHAPSYDHVPALAGASGARVVVGCSGGGVIASGREIEARPGLALVGAVLPGVNVAAFHVDAETLAGVDAGVDWRSRIGVPAGEDAHVLLLADPFTARLEPMLAGLDRSFPKGRTIGGLASGATEPGQLVLLEGATLHYDGAVGVALWGDIAVDAVVAQGCRPIGDPMFVTAAQENVVRTLDGRPASRVLRSLYDRLDARDQELFRHSLFLGIAMRESRETYRHGDFLIRNIVGLDAASGALVVGASPHDGSIVQFHLRDAAASAEDLEALLGRAAADGPPPRGALLFSCLGRGAGLYGHPDHDTDAFRRLFGEVPLGGFFCNGEVGPVHGATFVHGYTSSFALIAPRVR